MRASKVKVADLKTYTDCVDAIDSIKMDSANCVGGWKSWVSGRPTYITQAAENKIDAINRKINKFLDEEDES